MTERMRRFFGERGLPYNPHPDVVPNTMDALRLTELARDSGLHAVVHDRLMDAYWTEAKDIGDHDVLRAEAAAAGLSADEVDDVLRSDRYRDRVEASTREAHAVGANAVPAFVLDRRLLVLGAQPDEVFERAFRQLEDAH
jgi:predicted DsbA family dithiol-disulfide isomerase